MPSDTCPRCASAAEASMQYPHEDAQHDCDTIRDLRAEVEQYQRHSLADSYTSEGVEIALADLHRTKAENTRLRAEVEQAYAGIRGIRSIAAEYGASLQIWNAVAHEYRAERDNVHVPEWWAAAKRAERQVEEATR